MLVGQDFHIAVLPAYHDFFSRCHKQASLKKISSLAGLCKTAGILPLQFLQGNPFQNLFFSWCYLSQITVKLFSVHRISLNSSFTGK